MKKRKRKDDEEFKIHFQSSGRLKKSFTIIFPVFNLALAGTVIYLSMLYSEVSFSDVFTVSVNWVWIVVALVFSYLIVFVESFRMRKIMLETTGRKEYRLCLKIYFLERFYNMLTPFMSGGRPYVVWYLHKNKFTVAQNTSLVVSHYIVGRIAWQLITGIILVSLIHLLTQLEGEGIVLSAIIIGIVFNIALSAFFIFTALNRFIPEKLGALGVFLLFKIQIVKDKNKAKRNTNETLWKFRIAVRRMFRNKRLVVKTILMSSFAHLLHYLMIVPIYASLWGWDWSVIPLLLLGIVLTDYIASFIPLPGGTGGMELFFLSIFSVLMGAPQIFVALVFWRVLTHILPILNGIPVVLYDSFKRKNKLDIISNEMVDSDPTEAV